MPVSFGPSTSDASGRIVSIQSSNKRVKGASVIHVAASLDDAGAIVHEHGKKFHDLWLAPSGAIHAVSSDGFHHTNASGAWVKTRVVKGTLFAIWGITEDVVYATGDAGALFEIRGTTVTPIANELATDWFMALAGTAPDDVYAVGRNGMLHFDGTAWRPLTRFAGTHAGADGVACLSRDEVYVTTFQGLYAGNARDGFTRVLDRELQYLTRYGDAVYAASYGDGILRWANGAAKVLRADISITDLDGDGRYLCVTGMANAIHVFDGEAWRDKS